MVAVFCLRLALGLLALLTLLSPSQMHPRFFRTHFLTVLGLCLVAVMMFVWNPFTYVFLPVGAAVLAFIGAVLWTLDRPPGGWGCLVLTGAFIIAALVLYDLETVDRAWNDAGVSVDEVVRLPSWYVSLVDHLTAAAVLGSAVTAMLVGHSYLIAPAMSIRPLMRMLAALGIALLLRMAVAGVALGRWTETHDLSNLNDVTVLWLPVRWLIGLVGPLGFGWLAYQTARIRSTQSATGILYVVVILAFLGELTSLLLARDTGYPL